MFLRSPSIQSTLLLTAANLLMRSISMIFQVYLNNQVGAAGIGLLQLIFTVNGFALTLGTSGLRVAAMYFSAEEFGRRRLQGVRQAMMLCIRNGLLLSTLVGCCMAALARPIACYWVSDLRAEAGLRLLGLTLPITCLIAILSGYFTACGQIRKFVTVEIADRIASVALTASLLRGGAEGDLSHACLSIIGGNALASLGAAAVLLSIMLHDLPSRNHCPSDPAQRQRLRRFCMPVALNDYLRSGLGTLEQFLIPYGLARAGGSRIHAMADYGTIQGMVFPTILLPITLLSSAADLLIPALARCRAKKDHQRLHQLTARCLKISCLYACSIAGLCYLLAEPLGLLIFDSPDAGNYLRLFAPLIPILYLDCIIDGMHKGLGEQIYCVRVNTLTNLLDVIGLFLLLPIYGIGGYLLTYTVTHVLNFYLSLRRLLQISSVAVEPKFLTGMLAGVILAAGLTTLLVKPQPIRWSVLLCTMIYGTVLAMVWLVSGVIDSRNLRQYNGTNQPRRSPP